MRAWLVVAVLAAACGMAQAQVPDSLPAGVTPLMIRNGKLLYEGPGFCASCHGTTGAGVGSASGNLTDSTWAHSDGSFDGILRQIMSGLPQGHNTTGRPMPERGGSRLTENQLRAIAAYVWTLSRRPSNP